MRGLFLTFGFVIAAFFPFLALYLDSKGLSKSGIGLVIAAMAVARILLNPLWGHLADATLGRRTSLQIGAFLSAVFGLVLAGVDGVVAVAVAGAFLAGAMVSTGPNIDAITLEHLGADRMSDYGKIRSWESFTLCDRMPHARLDLRGRRHRLGDAGVRDRERARVRLVVHGAARRAAARSRDRWRPARHGGRGVPSTPLGSGGSWSPCSSCGRGSTPRGTSSR